MIYSVNYEELTSQMNPLAVVRYLESANWKNFPRKNTSIRVLQKEKGDARLQVVIPMDKRLSDYREAMFRSVKEISNAEGIPFEQLMLYLLNPNTDILKIRLARSDVEPGNILLDDAIHLYENAKKLIGAAAMDVRAPKVYHQGRSEALVKNFLDQCRFGQTEVGSYIISVVCPMADIDQDGQYRQLNLFSQEEELSESFTRRVTTKVMENLVQVKRCVDEDRVKDLSSVKKTHISANFYEALYGLLDRQNTELGVQADWFPGIRTPENLAGQVTLTSDYGEPIHAVISSMKREAPKQLTILGRIQKLESSPDLETRENGTITVAYLDKNSKSRRMMVSLDKEAYAEAVQAHLMGKYVEIRGGIDATKAGRSKMNGEIFRVLD